MENVLKPLQAVFSAPDAGERSMNLANLTHLAVTSVAGAPVWGATKWLSDKGVTDLLAAIGTVAATSFAVWQSDATGRDRRAAAKAGAQAALWGIESALEVLEHPKFTANYKGGQCRGVLNTLMEIPIGQLSNARAVEALIAARTALHVIADRADAFREQQGAGRRTYFLPGFTEQVEQLRDAATALRQVLGLPSRPVTEPAREDELVEYGAGKD